MFEIRPSQKEGNGTRQIRFQGFLQRYPVTVLGLIITLIVVIGTMYEGAGILPTDGPAGQELMSARELWTYGRISSPRFEALRHQLKERSQREHTAYWQDVYAIDREGELIPKHALLFTIYLTPFYGIFGDVGFLIASAILAIILLISCDRLIEYIAPRTSRIFRALVVLCGTELMLYSGHPSYDIFATTLFLGGLVLTVSSPLLGGLLESCTLFIRPLSIILVGISGPLFIRGWKLKQLRQWLCGVMLGVAGFGVWNTLFFGAPWITVYHRTPGYQDGHEVWNLDVERFSLHEFESDWMSKLFDPHVGLLIYNPVLIFLPYLVWQAIRFRDTVLILILGGILSYGGIVFSYYAWNTSNLGNRFFLIPILLFAIGVLRAFSLQSESTKNRV